MNKHSGAKAINPGSSIFDDSDVLDWFTELEDQEASATFVRSTLKEIAKQAGELDIYYTGRLLAAAEWIASMRGRKHADGLPIVDDLLRRFKRKTSEDVVNQCLALLDRVRDVSETRRHWETAGQLLNWYTALDDIRGRLRAMPITPPRQKRIRVQPGNIFRITLPNGGNAYGRVCTREIVQIYDPLSVNATDAAFANEHILFTVLLEWGPLENGTWPVVATTSIPEADLPQLRTFEQDRLHFRLRQRGRGWDVSVRECAALDANWYWTAAHVIERIRSGICSEHLSGYWPQSLNSRGELEPKSWSCWTEADFVRMEQATE
jgi:hypothetical protein